MEQPQSDFFERVWALVRTVPRGRVTTYGAVAKALGTAKSAFMVGFAMNASHTAPMPVPAHRVVNKQGLLSGKHHFGPPDMMQRLLESEGIEIVDDQIQHFATVFWEPPAPPVA